MMDKDRSTIAAMKVAIAPRCDGPFEFPTNCQARCLWLCILPLQAERAEQAAL
jgi:hypothetical protein